MDGEVENAVRRLIRLDPKLYSENGLKIFEFLKKHIKGQDDALLDVVDALEIIEASFNSEDKTIYTGLFLGGSGVGKTLVAQILALLLFGNRRAFTYVNCEFYSASHEGSRLFGSPPGYIGYNEPPLLAQENIDKYAIQSNDEIKKSLDLISEVTKEIDELEDNAFRHLKKMYSNKSLSSIREYDHTDKILKAIIDKRDRLINRLESLNHKAKELSANGPYRSIILFDEIEKANKVIHTALLSIIDNAEATMANGKITKFNNSIIIMTSNAGSGVISNISSGKRGIGFHLESESDRELNKDQQIYEVAMKAVQGIFPTEYVGRLDSVRVFRPLSRDTLMEIFDVEIEKFEESYLAKDFIHLKLSEEIKKAIVDEATDKQQYGARLLKNKISKRLKKQLARLKNRKELTPGDIIHVTLGADGKTIEFYKESPSNVIEPIKDPSSTT